MHEKKNDQKFHSMRWKKHNSFSKIMSIHVGLNNDVSVTGLNKHAPLQVKQRPSWDSTAGG